MATTNSACKVQRYLLIALLSIFVCVPLSAGKEWPLAGADEKTPSLAHYFSWINNTNEGSTEEQTMINLEFFEWLHDEYGMQLDIYAFDAGNIDGPRYYGSTRTDKYKKQFPNGFGPIYEKAKSIGCRLGVWLGPDGFGDTPEEEQARIDMLVKFCRDYEFILFKVDAVCGQLREEKQDAFVKLVKECRKYSPDLIILNHRLKLGDGTPHTTTRLWGPEAYIDVHLSNWQQTGTHNRVGAIARGLTPSLGRLLEDHGICISSCLDYWDDDLIVQGFARCLILAPEIYASPWFLRDDEYPKLARIYNLHRRYRDILVNGLELPEEQYGPGAVSRGDDHTRFVTLKNLTWNPVKYEIDLDDSIGLKKGRPVTVYQFHPTEKILGSFTSGRKVSVEVLPFRACLVMATTKPLDEVAVKGCDYQVIRDTPGKDVIVELQADPGSRTSISLSSGKNSFKKATLDGKDVTGLIKGKTLEVSFAGNPRKDPWHRKLGDLKACEIPADAEALYEATCFAANNDPLEMRSLRRSGPTRIEQVRKARQAFIEQDMIAERGIWDRFLFDGDLETVYSFSRNHRVNYDKVIRIDFAEPVNIDSLDLLIPKDVKRPEDVSKCTVEVSADLKSWKAAALTQHGRRVKIAIPRGQAVRYLRTTYVPDKISEIRGFYKNRKLDRSDWRCSYLFRSYAAQPPVKAWSHTIRIDQFAEGSYLCIPLEGVHGREGAYAALRMGEKLIGPPTRATSYISNCWEYPVPRRKSHYTYFVPVTKDMIGKDIDVFVLGFDRENLEYKSEVWITANPIPFESKQLVLQRK